MCLVCVIVYMTIYIRSCWVRAGYRDLSRTVREMKYANVGRLMQNGGRELDTLLLVPLERFKTVTSREGTSGWTAEQYDYARVTM